METKSYKKTVLQIIPHSTYSGVESSAKEIAANLVNNGYRVITLSGSKELDNYFSDLGIKHFCLNIHSSSPFIILKNAITISKIIKEENIDIVHARSRAPAWSCAIATKITNRFFITTFHAIYNNSNILKRYYNSVMTRGKKIIAISDFVKKYVIENYNIDPKRVVFIPRGIDAAYFNQDYVNIDIKEKFKVKYHVPDKVVIVMSADFSRWKGHIVMLEALSLIKDLKFYCLFVGDLIKHQNYTEEVRNKIVALKLQSKVRIFGLESNKRALYSISDIVVSASTQPEAFDKTIIEAQSMEKITLATNIGSSPEIISDNVNGFLVKSSNYQALSEKLRFIIENINSLEMDHMRQEARKSVIKNFALSNMIEGTSKLYDEILSKR